MARDLRNRHKTKKSGKQRIDYPLLCFDCETTVHGELLELSVYDLRGNEVYHEYFKPRSKKWPTDIHHITPEQVKDCKPFKAHRREIQKLLSSTHFLLGCALNNDLRILQRHGVCLSQRNHTVLDVQSWYWLLDDPSQWKTRQQTGLAAIAEHYGVDFGSGHAHSASADTRVTLECFRRMVEIFEERYPDNGTDAQMVLSGHDNLEDTQASLQRLNKRYQQAYERAMQHHAMYNAGGYVNVIQREQGYSIKCSKGMLIATPNVIFSHEVNDREKAEKELREYFVHKQLKGLTGIFSLDSADFDYIKAYRNEIDQNKYLKALAVKEESAKHRQGKASENLLPKKTATDQKRTTSATRSRKSRPSKMRAATQAMRVAKKEAKR
ncbi:MAG: 3'-5' exonuclease [Muribaculaceae bacterium]|nr:3'-5' exonuclease [Muribaculaceae bacterium]